MKWYRLLCEFLLCTIITGSLCDFVILKIVFDGRVDALYMLFELSMFMIVAFVWLHVLGRKKHLYSLLGK